MTIGRKTSSKKLIFTNLNEIANNQKIDVSKLNPKSASRFLSKLFHAIIGLKSGIITLNNFSITIINLV